MASVNSISIVVLVFIGFLAQSHGVSSQSSTAKSTLESTTVYSKGPKPDPKTLTSVDSTHATSHAPASSAFNVSIIPSIAPSSFNTPSSSASQSSSHTPPISYSSSSPVDPSSAGSSHPLDSSSTHMAPSSDSSTLKLPNSTFPVSPSINVTSVSGTATPSSGVAPSSSPSKGTSSHITPSKSSKPHPFPSTSPPKVIVECGEECKSLKKRLWAAGVFAVLLGLTTLVFMFLLFRQCKISRDYNDPALSRLI